MEILFHYRCGQFGGVRFTEAPNSLHNHIVEVLRAPLRNESARTCGRYLGPDADCFRAVKIALWLATRTPPGPGR